MNSTYRETCKCGAEYIGTDAGTHIKVEGVLCRVCLSCNSVIINKWHPIRARIAEMEAENERMRADAKELARHSRILHPMDLHQWWKRLAELSDRVLEGGE